jgi:hypothetical protein
MRSLEVATILILRAMSKLTAAARRRTAAEALGGVPCEQKAGAAKMARKRKLSSAAKAKLAANLAKAQAAKAARAKRIAAAA